MATERESTDSSNYKSVSEHLRRSLDRAVENSLDDTIIDEEIDRLRQREEPVSREELLYLQDSLMSRTERLENAEAARAALAAITEQQRTRLVEVGEDIAVLEIQVSDQEKEIKQLQEEIESLRSRFKKRGQRISELEKSHGQLSRRYQRLCDVIRNALPLLVAYERCKAPKWQSSVMRGKVLQATSMLTEAMEDSASAVHEGTGQEPENTQAAAIAAANEEMVTPSTPRAGKNGSTSGMDVV